MYVVTLYNPQPTSFFFRFWLKEIILCAEIFYGEWFYCSIFQLSHEYIYGSCDFISGEIPLPPLKWVISFRTKLENILFLMNRVK